MWSFDALTASLRRNRKRLAALSFAALGGVWSANAAAVLNVLIDKQFDGAVDPNTGVNICSLDASDQNGVLCTNDVARYRVDYQITTPPAAQNNVTLTVTIPAGEPFRFSPSSGGLANCLNMTTALSSDGRTITCQVAGEPPNPVNGPISNQSLAIYFDVYTNKEAKDGDTLSGVTASIRSDENPTGATATAPGVEVIARPQIDVVKRYFSLVGGMTRPANCSTSSAGTPGVAVLYRVALNLPEITGHEALQDGWSYVDNVSGMGADACVYSVRSQREYNGNLTTLPPGNDPATTPVDAGTGSYTFTQNGTSVTITASTTNPPLTSGEVTGSVTGALNATAVHYVYVWTPTTSVQPNPCMYTPQNEIEEFTAHGLSGTANTGDDLANNVSTHTGINICSGSFEKLYFATTRGNAHPTIASDNRMSNDLIGPQDYIDGYVYWNNTGVNANQVSVCDSWDNRKLVLDGEFDPSVHRPYVSANTAVGASSPYRWKTLPTTTPNRDWSPGYAHIYSSSAGATAMDPSIARDSEIQFGFIAFNGDETQLRDSTCNDADSTLAAVATAAGVPTTGIVNGWITQSDLLNNTALAPYVNSVRMRNVNVPPGGRLQVFTHLRTLAQNPENGNNWGDGTILPNYGKYQSSLSADTAPGTTGWRRSARAFMGDDPNAVMVSSGATACQQATNPSRYCDDGFSDRLRLSTQTVGIRKGIDGVDAAGGPTTDAPIVPRTKGQMVNYQLWPRLVSNDANVSINNDLVLIDTIPAGLKVMEDTIDWDGNVPEYFLDDQSATFGASTLYVRLPDQMATGTPATIPPVTFQAQILLDAPGNTANATLVNRVEIRACSPGASIAGGTVSCNDLVTSLTQNERSATRTVQLGAIDGVVVVKEVIGGARKEVGSTFTMGLRYQNVGNDTIDEHRLVDILPYNGEPDRGNPDLAADATDFGGTRPILEVRAPAATGYAVYYTTDNPATINTNPKCSSNITSVTGNWPNYAPGVPATAGCDVNTGSTTWVAATQSGATWTVPANTTALLMKDTTPFPEGATSRVFELDFETPGSRDGDRYSNNVSAAHGSAGTAAQPGLGAIFDVSSNNVTVRVFASSIRGTVFLDPDGNGATTGFDPANGDTGLGGQTVTLQQGGADIRTAVTAVADIPAGAFYNPADGTSSTTYQDGMCRVPAGGMVAGEYLFCDLPAGEYTVVETQPANHVTTGNRAGSSGGTVNGDTISAIQLAAETHATGYDFGERALTSVSGRVYIEDNGNTTDDGPATDPGISGVTVTLTYTPPGGGADVTLPPVTTDGDGNYSFPNLPVGATNVRIVQTQPPAHENLYNTPGTGGAVNGGDNPNTTTNSVITIPTLQPGGSSGNNFAEQRMPDLVSAIVCTPSAGNVSCTLTCTNNGPTDARNATCAFTSGLPSGVTVTCTPDSPQATLAPGATISCTTSAFPIPSTPFILRGGVGADNDSNGGTDPAQGNNGSSATIGASSPVPVPTLGVGGLILLGMALVGMAAGLRRRKV